MVGAKPVSRDTLHGVGVGVSLPYFPVAVVFREVENFISPLSSQSLLLCKVASSPRPHPSPLPPLPPHLSHPFSFFIFFPPPLPHFFILLFLLFILLF